MGNMRSLAVPALVATLAIAVLALGWMSFTAGSPRTPAEINGGSITVVTDDPAARISVALRLALDYGKTWENQPPPLMLNVIIEPSSEKATKWAIVLRDDAALPYSLEDPSGNALPRGDRRGSDAVWVQGNIDSAWYARNAGIGWPGEPVERFPNALGSVLAGTGPSANVIEIAVIGPTRGPLLDDTGPSQYTNLPVLGVPGYGPVDEATDFLNEAGGKPVGLVIGEGGLERVAPDIRTFMESTPWFYPEAYALTAELSDPRPADRLSQVEPPPAGPLDWTWAGTDRLIVRATVEQPDWVASAQRWQFLGGVLAGIAGGLIVWSMELAAGLTMQRVRRDG